MNFSIIARGQGIGEWNGNQTVKALNPKELSKYPSNSSVTKMDSTFLRLRKSELMIHVQREIVVEVNSYTDPVKSNLKISLNNQLSTISSFTTSSLSFLGMLACIITCSNSLNAAFSSS